MVDPSESLYANITLNDVQLAACYFPLLVQLARNNRTTTYGELVEAAQKQFPDKEYVQNAIPVSTGRKLDVVRIFATERGLPDISSLVLNKGEGECGKGFTDYFDPEKAREEVYAFDWGEVDSDFDIYIEEAVSKVTPRKTVRRPEARRLMSGYHLENKSSLPGGITEWREHILALIMEGFTAEEAFDDALKRL